MLRVCYHRLQSTYPPNGEQIRDISTTIKTEGHAVEKLLIARRLLEGNCIADYFIRN